MKNSMQSVGHVILKKGLLSALLLFALLFGIVGSAQADGMVQLAKVQTGVVIENDVFLTGQNPTVDRHRHLCLGRDCQKGMWSEREGPLQNFTGPESVNF